MGRTMASEHNADSLARQSEAEFLRIYSLAVRTASVHAAIRSAQLTGIERQDLIQDALIAVWQALRKYDASRASLLTFIEVVVRTRTASTLRSFRTRRQLEPVADLNLITHGNFGNIELRTDVCQVINRLGANDRRLARLLAEHSPTEVSRILGIARSTLYEGIGRIRVAFTKAGLTPSWRSS
jgi:RNA polymerase sigma factor (sigma-70 family)